MVVGYYDYILCYACGCVFWVCGLDWLDFGYVVLIVGIDCCGLTCDLFWVRLGGVSVGIVCSFYVVVGVLL